MNHFKRWLCRILKVGIAVNLALAVPVLVDFVFLVAQGVPLVLCVRAERRPRAAWTRRAMEGAAS